MNILVLFNLILLIMDIYWSVFNVGNFTIYYSLKDDKINRLILSSKTKKRLDIFSFCGKYQKRLYSELEDKITEFFNGVMVNFDEFQLELNIENKFIKKVLIACRNISYGKTTSYAKLAKMCGSKNAARAVGNALSNNPICLIIPCHRVIRSDGKIGGFRYGQEVKLKLLEIEGFLI